MLESRVRMIGYLTVIIFLALATGCSFINNPPIPNTVPTEAAGTPLPLSESSRMLPFAGLELRTIGAGVPSLDLAQATGARWARFPVRWDRLEPEPADPPYYHWSWYDGQLRSISEHGFQIVVTLRESPTWASPTRCGPLNEQGRAAYPRMLRDVVGRYSASPYNVKHWEIFNEPDNADPVKFPLLGGCWGGQPAAYAELLKIAYTTIKSVDPEATVIFGGLALEKFDGSPFNVDFLKQVLEAGGAPYFDWVSFHYYAAFSYRWDRFGHGVEGKVNYIRKIMKDAGVEKPVACSEIGQPSAGPAAEKYSDELQVAQVIKEHAQAAAADLRFAIWYCLQDVGGDERMFGLLDTVGRPKPAYTAYQTVVRALNEARFERVLSPEETGSAKIEAFAFYSSTAPSAKLLIAWRTEAGAVLPLPLPTAKAIIIDATGNETEVVDGGTGDLNPATGALSVGIGPAPVLVKY